MSRHALLALPLLLRGVQGALTPLEPSSADQVFLAGQNCSFSYKPDADGTWTSVNVDLVSGSNVGMVNVTRVATDLDATLGGGAEGATAVYNFTCPEVDPPAPIYFYQFSVDGEDPLWTSRFTLAQANGSFGEASNAIQPDGQAIPWGIGHLVNSTNSTALNSTNDGGLGNLLDPFSKNSSSKPLDQPLLPTSASSSTTAWWTPETTAASSAGGEAQPTSAAAGVTGFQQGIACDSDTPCPSTTPCCSEKGFCGAGRNCLAGCNPFASYQPEACAPVPACQSGEYGLNYWDKNRVLTNSSLWNGDASTYDWLVDSIGDSELGALTADGTTGNLALTLSLTNENNGTTITSTRSVFYGNITASIKSVAGAGIITAFSLTSGTKDEIDYEWTTNSTDLAQTAFFYRGDVDNYSSGQSSNISDRAAEFHDYTISWTPDAISWLVDGLVLRNVTKNSTVDPENPAVFRYPQTPSRIQFSIWAAGRQGNPQGLVDFVGGNIDWNASTYVEKGYYASYVSSVKVDCYDPSLLPGSNTSTLTAASGVYDASLGASSASTWNTDVFQTNPLEDMAPSSTDSSSTTVWWTAPTASSAVNSAAVTTETATTTTTSSTAWWTPAVRQVRRFIQFAKRQDASSSSYSYGDLDENGQVGVSYVTGLGNIDTSSSASSDLSASATDSPSASATDSIASATASDSATASATSTSTTLTDKWNDLGTGAHIGIYIGGALAAVFLLVLMGWIWRTASRARQNAKTGPPPADAGGSYAKINDMGEMEAGTRYQGDGTINPSMGLYDESAAAIPPTASSASASTAPSRKSSLTASVAAVPATMLEMGRKASSASTSSKKSFQGGYVPSSQLREQYGMRQTM
ncbi:hypothetical protein JCM8547_000098 [Rhodosporidiobolus lusitaniae]